MKMKLALVIQAMEEAGDSYTIFYDAQEGKTVYLPDEFVTGERDAMLEDLIENNRNGFLRFPDKYEIHEYSIMEQYIDWLPRGKVKTELSSAICGKGAFRRFKATLRYHSLEQQWYDFKAEVFCEMAIRWCEENGLEISRYGVWTSSGVGADL